jgi:hypothetical protein
VRETKNRANPLRAARPTIGCAMPLRSNRTNVILKLTLVAWGGNLAQGAALSFFVSGAHQNRETSFIDLVYGSVLVGGLVSLLSSRVGSLLLFASAVAALAMLLWTNSSGLGLGPAGSLVLEVAVRPALGSLLLLILFRWEKRSAGQR